MSSSKMFTFPGKEESRTKFNFLLVSNLNTLTRVVLIYSWFVNSFLHFDDVTLHPPRTGSDKIQFLERFSLISVGKHAV